MLKFEVQHYCHISKQQNNSTVKPHSFNSHQNEGFKTDCDDYLDDGETRLRRSDFKTVN
jgi:hypothetical protein